MNNKSGFAELFDFNNKFLSERIRHPTGHIKLKFLFYFPMV